MHSCQCRRYDDKKECMRKSISLEESKKIDLKRKSGYVRVPGPLPLTINISSYAVIASSRTLPTVVFGSTGHRDLKLSMKS